VTVAPSDFKEPPRYRASLAEWEWFRTWFSSQGLLCWVCGIAAWTDLHHILSRSQGGDDDIVNLAPVCRPCHERIEARDPWARSQIRQALMPSNIEYLERKTIDAVAWLQRQYPVLVES
jgi:5-methylcytosine-specific restriction endonuclease McrA